MHEPTLLDPLPFEDLADELPVMVWRINGSFDRDWANKAWYEFTGGTVEGERSFGWVGKVHPDERDRVVDEFDRAFDERAPITTEFRLLASSGDYRLVRDTGQPVFKEGCFLGFVGTRVDVTAVLQDGARAHTPTGTSVAEVLAAVSPMLGAAFGARGLLLEAEGELRLAPCPITMVSLLGELARSAPSQAALPELHVRVARWGELGVVTLALPRSSGGNLARAAREEEGALGTLLSREGGRLWVEERGDDLSLVSISLPLASCSSNSG